MDAYQGMRNLGDLQHRCRITAQGCWRFVKPDGTLYNERTVPMVGSKPQIQIAVLALRFAGRELPRGWKIVRQKNCIKHCCNPAHLTMSEGLKWRVGDTESRNPRGNPESLPPGDPKYLEAWRKGK